MLRAVVDEGGFGRVYLGVDADGVRAAVKVLHRDLLSSTALRARERFGREIEFLDRVGRVGAVPRLLEAAPHDDPPWLATEFVDGLPLSRVQRRGAPLPISMVIRLIATIGRTLVELHEHGAHRDLKPGNILITTDGPQLVDFGLARGPDDHPFTRVGEIVGTPAFMAPERITPWPDHGGDAGAADVFELAGTMLYAATGHGPYPLLEFPESGPPPQPGASDIADLFDVDDDLRSLLEPALAHRPNDRPTAAELRDRAARLDVAQPFAALLPAEVAADLHELARARTPLTEMVTGPTVARRRGPAGTRVATARPVTQPPEVATPVVDQPGTSGAACWSQRLAGPVAAMGPAPDGGILVVTRAGDVHAIDVGGRTRWSQRLTSPPTGAVAALGRHVHLGTASGQVHILDERGVLIDHPWVGGAVGALVGVGGRVLAAGDAGVICALTGRHRGVADERALGAAVRLPFLVRDGLVLAATADGALHALNAASLRPRWRRPLDEHVLAMAGTDDHLVATTAAGDLLGLARQDGRTLWTVRLAGQAWALEVDPGRGVVVAVTVDGTATLVTAEDGRQLRRIDLGTPVRRSIARGRPGEVLVGGLDGSVRAIDTGELALDSVVAPGWPTGGVEVPPAIVGHLHLFGRADGTLTAVSLATSRAA